MPKRQIVVLEVPYPDERYPPSGWNWDQLLDTTGTRLLEVREPTPEGPLWSEEEKRAENWSQ